MEVNKRKDKKIFSVLSIVLFIYAEISCTKNSGIENLPETVNMAAPAASAETPAFSDTLPFPYSQITDVQQADILSEKPGFNKRYRSLYDLYYSIPNLLDGDYSGWENGNILFCNAILAFFNSEESLSVDILEETPVHLSAASDDGLLQTYGWGIHSNGLEANTIIQYITRSGNPEAVLVSGFSDVKKFYESEARFEQIYTITDTIYLLEGIYHPHGSMRINYLAVELRNKELKTYPAFNGEAGLKISIPVKPLWADLIAPEDDFYHFSNNKFDYVNGTPMVSFKYSRFNDKTDGSSSKVLPLVWNGIEFAGDYKIFFDIVFGRL